MDVGLFASKRTTSAHLYSVIITDLLLRAVLPAAAALLERQMVVFCPNIGVLSAAVLALVPLMRPFAWQSLLLPVLPVQEKMLDLLEAPVPFIFGIKVCACYVLSWVEIYICSSYQGLI